MNTKRENIEQRGNGFIYALGFFCMLNIFSTEYKSIFIEVIPYEKVELPIFASENFSKDNSIFIPNL